MAMAADLGSRIRYESMVTGLAATPAGVQVELADGTSVRAPHCVCTLPAPILRGIEPNLPSMSQEQRRAIQEVSYTRVTVAMFDAEPFWNDDGLPPYMWTDTALERVFPRVTPDGARCIGMKAFVNGAATIELDALSEQDFERATLDILTRVRPASRGQVSYRRRHCWGADPFAGGAWASWSAGRAVEERTAMRRYVGAVRFAGEHTALDAPGMEGAVRSGERAALDIIEGVTT